MVSARASVDLLIGDPNSTLTLPTTSPRVLPSCGNRLPGVWHRLSTAGEALQDGVVGNDARGAMARRVRPTESGTELETLMQLLDFLRATVATKATGLTDEQAASHPVPASELTVSGLVKHLTGTERFWFSIDFAALDVPWPWTDDDPHGDFTLATTDTVANLVAGYEAECERSQRAVAGQELDAIARAEGRNFSLRYALAP